MVVWVRKGKWWVGGCNQNKCSNVKTDCSTPQVDGQPRNSFLKGQPHLRDGSVQTSLRGATLR